METLTEMINKIKLSSCALDILPVGKLMNLSVHTFYL